MSKIHHITFATGNSRVTGDPYSITQKLLVDSIKSQTKRNVVIHSQLDTHFPRPLDNCK